MGFIREMIQEAQTTPFGTAVALGGVLVVFFVWSMVRGFRKRVPLGLQPLPEVPGLPVVGNLLQLKDKKPYKTFTRWSETYGPIYSIRAGASSMVIINSTELAKETMVTRYNSISSRKLSHALKILTHDKTMVAISDYNDFHKTVKKYILTNVLGVNAQKKHRCHRVALVENITRAFHLSLKNDPSEPVNFRAVFENELFGLGLKEALGKDVKSIYVEGLGATLSKEDVYKVLVTDLMAGAIEVDWRDFFPYLRWIPNNVVNKIRQLDYRRRVVMLALINEQRKRLASGEKTNGYVDFLLSEENLTEEQLIMLVWETIIETSDTTLVTSEWAMYELAKDPERQERLYKDIKKVCGSEKISEDHISQLPYLSAVFHETLRKHSPAPIVPLRYAHEDTKVGGYFIPAGSEIAINIYGCHMDKKQWQSPEKFKPERFLDPKYDPADLYKTMAFGAGKRVCAGSLQASLIACTAIGRLVQEFEWRLKDGEEDKVDTVGLTTHKLDPMHAMLKARN